MSYKTRVSSSGASKTPQFKETSTFDWNSIRNLVEKEKNSYIKTHLILSCLKGRAASLSKQESLNECDLLLYKFIQYFLLVNCFPNLFRLTNQRHRIMGRFRKKKRFEWKTS